MFIKIGSRIVNLAYVSDVVFVDKDKGHRGIDSCEITLASGKVLDITHQEQVIALKEYFTNDDHFINVVGCKMLD